ncbi:hypothetical protein [Oceanobacillus jeddahense]|uniref:BshB3 potential contributor to bacillithiol synthesis n=1 Tax=Oceanobacillus jeddahense TaxID=1462527 RepID=A0ABY5JVN4_9BACI|nr:hypothetical protein [Oceanobacillus jeddahense]UUI03131.1 hypothetical protein NP439_24395 [Oceanobacillus jeddahense]
MELLHILIILVIIICFFALAGTIFVTKRLDDNYERQKSFSSLSYIYFIGLPATILAAVLIWLFI